MNTENIADKIERQGIDEALGKFRESVHKQQRYEIAKAVLTAIKTHPSKYGNSPESMRDAAWHAIKQADVLLELLGREKPGQCEAPTIEGIAKIYAHEATTAWRMASFKGDTRWARYFDGYQAGLNDALEKASGQEPNRDKFKPFIQEVK